MILAWPDEAIRPRPLRPLAYDMACREPALDVAENLGEVFCVVSLCTGQENDFKLILAVKIETRHSVEGSFVRSLLQAGVLNWNLLLVQCASPGRGGNW